MVGKTTETPAEQENGGQQVVRRNDTLSKLTGGYVDQRGAATGAQVLSHFVPGGTFLELGAIAALADADGQDAQVQRITFARRLGVTPEFLEANSSSLRALAQDQAQNTVSNALAEASPSAIGGMIGGAFGLVVPIPGASILGGLAGSQMGAAIGGSPKKNKIAEEFNLRTIVDTVEAKQHYGQEVTPEEAFLLALAPDQRKIVYNEMARRFAGADPETAKSLFKDIIFCHADDIRSKVEDLGIEVDPDENPVEVLAHEMNKVNPRNGRKLHPLLVLMDDPKGVSEMLAAQQQVVQQQQFAASSVGDDGASLQAPNTPIHPALRGPNKGYTPN